ncbi:acyl-CoA dehydrogenase family protein [Nocardia rhamnosiphila]|uniref:Acyl-CoA dehydrogenase family protein n=1 Tax=Nocardia rhamnosiphila TaxID=426716 RepID=A0ABV2X0P1_9NOCA
MDLHYNAQAEAYRSRVRELIARTVPQDWRGIGQLDSTARAEFLPWWRKTLQDHRLLAPGWPEEYGGGGRGIVEQSITMEELVRAGLPQTPLPNDACGFTLLGPTLLHWGTPEQKAHYLERTIDGTIRWAQGYSEPEAGSDLFNLRAKARLDGDSWVVNGQKIWQTAGLSANWIFVLVRTDPEAERSKGLSFLLVPIDQPGVEVRGIRNMAGEVEFAEVFFNDARTDADNVVGGVGNGAKVALTLLGFERAAGGVAAALAAQIELERLVHLARSTGRNRDRSVRQRIADCRTSTHVLHCLALRTLTAAAAARPPGPESSITKLVASEYRKRVTELAVDLLDIEALAPRGAEAIAALGPEPLGLDPESSAAWVTDFLHARPGTVYGGSSEIQRNTIGEQVLGLPREPRVTNPRTERPGTH